MHGLWIAVALLVLIAAGAIGLGTGVLGSSRSSSDEEMLIVDGAPLLITSDSAEKGESNEAAAPADPSPLTTSRPENSSGAVAGEFPGATSSSAEASHGDDRWAAESRPSSVVSNVPESSLVNVDRADGGTLEYEQGNSQSALGVTKTTVMKGGKSHDSVAEPDETEKLPNGSLRMTFKVLASFDYVLPDPMRKDSPKDQIPASVLAYDGIDATLSGYMLPLSTRGGRVYSFYLARDVFGCCFGDAPKLSEMVEVTVPGNEGVPVASGIPVSVRGTLHVGEKKDEFGYVDSIYRIEASHVQEEW